MQGTEAQLWAGFLLREQNLQGQNTPEDTWCRPSTGATSLP